MGYLHDENTLMGVKDHTTGLFGLPVSTRSGSGILSNSFPKEKWTYIHWTVP